MRKAFLASAILIFLSAIIFVSSIGPSDSPRGTLNPPAATAQVLAAKNLPLEFIPNAGQTNSRVSFYIKGSDRTVYFTPDGVTLALYKESKAKQPKQIKVPVGPEEIEPGPRKSLVVKIDFVGAQKDVVPEGLDRTGAVFSYFKGKREDWRIGLPGYRKIIYRDLWPGIDLVYKGDVGRLKYEFLVAPGADPGLIQLGIRGTSDVEVDEEGRLVLKTPLENIVDEKPLVFQESQDGERKLVSAAYRMEKISEGSAKVGFSLANYDHSLPLVIDPATLVYCGYIGGGCGNDIALDGSGNAYIAGYSYASWFLPVTVGPDLTPNGDWEAFVAKVNASGTGLVYCGYIGGLGEEQAYGIAVDGSGNAYVTGYTFSEQATFPVTVGPDLTYNGGRDAFVAKVDATGTNLDYCGYIGGDNWDWGYDIAVDGAGNAYITGITDSYQSSFPVTVGPDLTKSLDYDAFVAKVSGSGTGLSYCGYIGGFGYDSGSAIAVDSSGNAYVTGATYSDQSTFPVKGGPDTTHNGDFDAFVAKISASGASFTYCGYIGGDNWDWGYGIAVDGADNAYVVGVTRSSQTTFPVTVGPELTFKGDTYDGFVAKVSASGASLMYCGYIGGSNTDFAVDIAVDGYGNTYIIGTTYSNQTTFPVIDGPDLTYNGNADGYVAKVNPSGAGLVYCGYIGGVGDDGACGVAVDGSGNAYVTGYACSDESSFPVIVGPDLTHNNPNYGSDAFVAKISPAGARMANLSLSKSVDNIRPYVDDTISFTIALTNLGPRNATGVKVADKLPAGLSFVSSDVTRGTYDPASGLWTIGNLEDQTSAALTLRARVDKDGTIINTAMVAAMNESDPDPLNNEASITLVAEHRVYAPSNFQVQRLENDFIFYKEYINRLTWTANPLNRGVIVSYRLYRKAKGQPDDSFVFYKEFDVSLTSFDDRGLKKDDLFSYRLTSVNDKGRESEPVELVEGGVEHDRLAPRPGRRIFIPPLIIRPDHK
jgi:uncharacterized repeat protein (TIGR01451 family)